MQIFSFDVSFDLRIFLVIIVFISSWFSSKLLIFCYADNLVNFCPFYFLYFVHGLGLTTFFSQDSHHSGFDQNFLHVCAKLNVPISYFLGFRCPYSNMGKKEISGTYKTNSTFFFVLRFSALGCIFERKKLHSMWKLIYDFMGLWTLKIVNIGNSFYQCELINTVF